MFPYQDSLGLWTIGVGRNIEEMGISHKEAMLLLDNDLQRTISELEGSFDWFDYLPSVVADAIINLGFNIGLTKLLGFKKMLAALEDGDWDTAADELMDSRYARQVGQRANDLAHMVRFNEYPEMGY